MPSSRILLAGLLGLLVACGSSGSSDSGGDSGGSTPNLTFSFASSTVVEDQSAWNVQIQLDQAHDQDVDVSFGLGGNAFELADYFLISGMPVTIPKGELSALVNLLILEDEIGELDETIEMYLVPPVNAKLGGLTTHVVTIRDDDEVPVNEVEPNDDHLNAQSLGNVQDFVSYEVQGEALAGDMDVYALEASGSTTVFVSMDPASAVAEVVINLLDQDGNIIATFDDDIPGTTISTSFDVSDGESFFLAVTVGAFGTSYVLDIVGV